MRMRWTEETITSAIVPYIEKLGRMPTATELYATGNTKLAVTIGRLGGYRAWAKKLNVEQKGTETHRAQIIEDQFANWLKSENINGVRQSTRAPFDFLINGHVRVDVKSARAYVYGPPDNRKIMGFVFGINKKIPTCDVYVLCGLDSNDVIMWRYFIPAKKAQVVTLTITPAGKYSKYKEATRYLRKLIEPPKG
jgi:hypothetical protein